MLILPFICYSLPGKSIVVECIDSTMFSHLKNRYNIVVSGWFFLSIIFLISFGTCMTAVIMFIQQRGRYGRPVPKWARRVFFHSLPRLLCMYVPEKLATEVNGENTLGKGSKEKNNGLEFPLVHYVIKKKFDILFLNHFFKGKDITGVPLLRTNQNENVMSPAGSFYPTSKPMDIDDLMMTVELRKIREEIRKLRNDIGVSEKEDRIEWEWEYLTAVPDRLLLFVFSIAVLIVTGALLIVGNINVQY